MADTPALTDDEKAAHAEKYEIDWEPATPGDDDAGPDPDS